HVPFHLYHHTERSLRKLLGQSGFGIRRLETVTPGEFVLLSLDAWRNARRDRYELEPFEGRYPERILVAPPARLLDALWRGHALYGDATPVDPLLLRRTGPARPPPRASTRGRQ